MAHLGVLCKTHNCLHCQVRHHIVSRHLQHTCVRSHIVPLLVPGSRVHPHTYLAVQVLALHACRCTSCQHDERLVAEQCSAWL